MVCMSNAAAEVSNMRYSRAEYAKVLALQQEVSRAEADYQRLRAAYLEIARNGALGAQIRKLR